MSIRKSGTRIVTAINEDLTCKVWLASEVTTSEAASIIRSQMGYEAALASYGRRRLTALRKMREDTGE